MQYLVNGKVFESEEEARKYEQQCNFAKFSNKLKSYEIEDKRTSGVSRFIYVVADSDWVKYAKAIAGEVCGLMYSINHETNKLVTNYVLRERKLTEQEVFNFSYLLNRNELPNNVFYIDASSDASNESSESSTYDNNDSISNIEEQICGVVSDIVKALCSN